MLYWVLVSFRLSLLISPKIGFRYHAFGIVSCMLFVIFCLREILASGHPMGYDSIKQNGLAETRRAPTVSLQFFPVCLIPPRTCTPHQSVSPCPTPAAPSPWLPPLSLSPRGRDPRAGIRTSTPHPQDPRRIARLSAGPQLAKPLPPESRPWLHDYLNIPLNTWNTCNMKHLNATYVWSR
jgi:hypothetical protein